MKSLFSRKSGDYWIKDTEALGIEITVWSLIEILDR